MLLKPLASMCFIGMGFRYMLVKHGICEIVCATTCGKFKDGKA